MVVWLAFVVFPLIFLIVVIVGIKGQGGEAMKLAGIAVLAVCLLGASMPSENLSGRRSGLLDSRRRHTVLPSPLLHKSAQIKTSDASLDPEDSMQKIDPLKRRLPDRQRLPVLRGIVLEGINNIESGIELADRVQRTEKSIRSGLLAQDAAERQLKQLIREAEDGRKVMAENIKKLCAYMAHPEEPLDKFPSEEIPKNCSTL